MPINQDKSTTLNHDCCNFTQIFYWVFPKMNIFEQKLRQVQIIEFKVYISLVGFFTWPIGSRVEESTPFIF